MHTEEEAEVSTYFQPLIFNQDIILSIQIFIINITEMFIVLNGETFKNWWLTLLYFLWIYFPCIYI